MSVLRMLGLGVVLVLVAWPGGPASAAEPPVNTGLPAVSGSPLVGDQLSCSTGSWTGDPTSFGFAWTSNGDPVVGATQATYVVTQADFDHALRCVVTATNDAGSGVAKSARVLGGLLPGACANERDGTSGADWINGSRAGDLIRGFGGRDLLAGFPGDDCIEGGDGDDRLFGNIGDDRIDGGQGRDFARAQPGEDTVRGGPGNDHLEGGQGADHLVGGPGADALLGGPGDDLVDARDGFRDVVRCGVGDHDRAVVDRLDMTFGCEAVSRG